MPKQMKKIILTAYIALFIPNITLAQGGGTNIFHILNLTKSTLNYIIGIIISLALIFFIQKVTKNIITGDAEERANGKNTIIYGIIGLFVIVAIWGIVNFVGTTLGVSNPLQGTAPGYNPAVSQ